MKRLMYSYCLYGLWLRSQWPLPYPEGIGSGLAEVDLFEGSASLFADASRQARTQLFGTEWFRYNRLQDGSDYLRWSSLFEFLISADGRRIAARSLVDASSTAFQTYLLGQVLSFVLLKQRIETLHAIAVVLDGEAVGLMGDSGYGKSSLGASFLRAGHRLLTDDLFVVKEEGHGFSVYPGPPRIKLYPEVARSLLGEGVKGLPMNSLTPKLVIPLDCDQFYPTVVPLKAIYALARPTASSQGHKVTIRSLSRRWGFRELLKNTYNFVVVEPERLKCQFALASQIVSKVPIKLLSYPRTLTSLASVCEEILSDLRR